MDKKIQITVTADISAPVDKVWKYYNSPEYVVKWNNASPDWHTPKAVNDLKAGGKFVYRMEAKDGSVGFDFSGVYTAIKKNELVEYTMDDTRKAKIVFKGSGNKTNVSVTFEAENENPLEMQKDGWQSILNNFKKYVESN